MAAVVEDLVDEETLETLRSTIGRPPRASPACRSPGSLSAIGAPTEARGPRSSRRHGRRDHRHRSRRDRVRGRRPRSRSSRSPSPSRWSRVCGAGIAGPIPDTAQPMPPELGPVLAIAGLILVKEAGVPIPVPGDLIVIGAGVAAGRGELDPRGRAGSRSCSPASSAGSSSTPCFGRWPVRRCSACSGGSAARPDSIARPTGFDGAAFGPWRSRGRLPASGSWRSPRARSPASRPRPSSAGLAIGNALFISAHFALGYLVGRADRQRRRHASSARSRPPGSRSRSSAAIGWVVLLRRRRGGGRLATRRWSMRGARVPEALDRLLSGLPDASPRSIAAS